jgi:hypothetical protein
MGEDRPGERRPTLLFNGYGEFVADLYRTSKASGCGRDHPSSAPVCLFAANEPALHSLVGGSLILVRLSPMALALA